MAGCGPWVAVLSLFCLFSTGQLDKVKVVPLVGDVASDTDGLCAEYSDGTYLRTIDVYDLIKENFQMEIPDVNDELLMDFMKFADEDGDQQLSLQECDKLVKYIQKKD